MNPAFTASDKAFGGERERHEPRGPAEPGGLHRPRIDVIAPSGAVLEPARLTAGIARLQTLGCRVRSRVPAQSWQRFGGTDEQRLEQIHAAASATDVDVVMIARGGYGLSRLLDRVDWPLVARSVERGVRWIGYSDFTAFQLALLAETGAHSWAGPSVCGDFGGSEPEAWMLEQFQAVLGRQVPGIAWRAPATACVTDAAHPPGRSGSYGDAKLDAPGTLWGGNLAMLASLAGTRWMPRVPAGLLFVEDIAEHPYRVERMLLQLLHAGALDGQRALLLGSFTDWRPAPHDNGYDLAEVARYIGERAGLPVVTGLPFGHVARRAVLGVGLRYRLRVSAAATGRIATAAGELEMRLDPV